MKKLYLATVILFISCSTKTAPEPAVTKELASPSASLAGSNSSAPVSSSAAAPVSSSAAALSASASSSVFLPGSASPAVSASSTAYPTVSVNKPTSSLSLEELECEEFAAQIEFEEYACSFEN